MTRPPLKEPTTMTTKAKTCAYCGGPAEGNYSVHRDGFGDGPARVALASLSDRERHLLIAIYFRDADQDEASSAIGISKSWGCRLHNAALSKCRKAVSRCRA